MATDYAQKSSRSLLLGAEVHAWNLGISWLIGEGEKVHNSVGDDVHRGGDNTSRGDLCKWMASMAT